MKPKESFGSFESDLIFFAIKATRSTGIEKLKYLKQLKNLASCEYTYYKKKKEK